MLELQRMLEENEANCGGCELCEGCDAVERKVAECEALLKVAGGCALLIRYEAAVGASVAT